VYLSSIFLQTVLGFSALQAGLSFLPMALALAAGTHVAAKALSHLAPRSVAATGLSIAAVAASARSCRRQSRLRRGVLPGLLLLGLGVGMVFVCVSITAMHGIPPQHAGTGLRLPHDRARDRRSPRRRRPVRRSPPPPARLTDAAGR
jgi:hypothetical protein